MNTFRTSHHTASHPQSTTSLPTPLYQPPLLPSQSTHPHSPVARSIPIPSLSPPPPYRPLGSGIWRLSRVNNGVEASQLHRPYGGKAGGHREHQYNNQPGGNLYSTHSPHTTHGHGLGQSPHDLVHPPSPGVTTSSSLLRETGSSSGPRTGSRPRSPVAFGAFSSIFSPPSLSTSNMNGGYGGRGGSNTVTSSGGSGNAGANLIAATLLSYETGRTSHTSPPHSTSFNNFSSCYVYLITHSLSTHSSHDAF